MTANVTENKPTQATTRSRVLKLVVQDSEATPQANNARPTTQGRKFGPTPP